MIELLFRVRKTEKTEKKAAKEAKMKVIFQLKKGLRL